MRGFAVVLLGLLLFGSLPAAAQQTTTFTDVASTKNTGFRGFDLPSVNRAGVVAFMAGRTVGGEGIYIAFSQRVIQPVALTTAPEFKSFAPAQPMINASGQVLFQAIRKERVGGGDGIYVARAAGQFTPIAYARTAKGFDHFRSACIDAAGRVIFAGSRIISNDGLSTQEGVYATENAPGYKILASFPNVTAACGDSPIMNDKGAFAFFVTQSVNGHDETRLCTAPSAVAPIQWIPCPPNEVFVPTTLGINYARTVLYTAKQNNDKEIICVVREGTKRKIVAVAPSKQFIELGDPGLNDAGTVAFCAKQPNGWCGIHVIAPGSSPFRVVQEGDALFGSTIRCLGFAGRGFSGNHLAFSYTLKNGVSGIARADLWNGQKRFRGEPGQRRRGKTGFAAPSPHGGRTSRERLALRERSLRA